MTAMHHSHHVGSSFDTDVTENILFTFSCHVHTTAMVTNDDENDCCVLREKVESERLSHIT
jgi:hypothetical protein